MTLNTSLEQPLQQFYSILARGASFPMTISGPCSRKPFLTSVCASHPLLHAIGWSMNVGVTLSPREAHYKGQPVSHGRRKGAWNANKR